MKLSCGHKQYTGKLLYGAFFVLALPCLLALLAQNLKVPFPAYQAPASGIALLVIGLILMVSGMVALIAIGQGLPMNAYPPRHLVTRQIYALAPHPIYCGFVLACAGVSLYFGSASGLWAVTPLCALGVTALVWGYERPFLLRRHQHLAHPWLGPPSRDTALHRTGAMLAVLLPWLIAFQSIKFLGAPADAMTPYLPGEAEWPVWVWSYPVYAAAYAIVPLAFLLTPMPALQKLFYRGWVGIALMTVLYLLIPVVSPVRVIAVDGWLARCLQMEMTYAAPYTAAFPSYHVVWTMLATAALAEKGRAWAWSARIAAFAIALSCVTTGMHTSADVAAGAAAGLLLCRIETVWRHMLRITEWLANSFRERRFGRIRILNHALYAFLSGFLCLSLVLALLGADRGIWAFCMLLFALIVAALWGQRVEGASELQRPYGYFGSLIGAIAGNAILWALGLSYWLLLAAFACAAPWVQAIGRIRCLVQGCCHGREIPPDDGAGHHGIVVTNPHSRVVCLSKLDGRAIYPTQLFSIIGNLVIGLLLFRCWMLAAPIGAIFGIYLTGSGLLRFVEEGYRGEVQTPVHCGLPIYQWLSIVMAALGCLLLCLPVMAVPPLPDVHWKPCLSWALSGGIAAMLLMSVDMPDSNRRFARLSG